MERGIIKILGSSATSFAACIYNGKKVAQGKAEAPIMLNFGDLEKFNIHSPFIMSRYLQKIADQNPNVKHPQLHLMGSLPGNPSDEEKKQFIGHMIQVLNELGYEGQPIAIWPHIDTKNWHVHSATVRVNQETGEWINNYLEGKRARHVLDRLRGVNTKNNLEKFLDFRFETREQFINLLRANGFRKSYYDEELDIVRVIRASEEKHYFTMDEIQKRIDVTGKNKDNQKERIKELRGILRDRRQRSMNYLVDDPDVKITKDGKRHTVTEKLRDVRGAAFEGDNGLDIKGIRKAQFKQFLEELKEKMGIGIVFNQWKDGTTKGYTLIDYKSKTIFKGSDILALDELLNPNWKKGQEKDQVLTADEAYESTQKLIDSPTLASDIYEELTALNLDIYEPDENEMTDIAVNFSNEEQEHRQEAVRIFKQLISEHKGPVDDFQDDYRSICEEGQKAYNHAATAEWLKRLKEERDEKEQAKTTDMADDEPSKREKLAWNEVGDYILDYFNSNDIEYNYKPTFEIKINGMDEKKARQLAFEKFEEAIYAHDNGSKNAADIAWEALAYAQVMERLHEDPELINRYVDQQAVDETQPVQAPTYPEEERERETVNNHIPKHENLAGIGERERAQAIDEARETMTSYGNRRFNGFRDDDILSISRGIVARTIERNHNCFNEIHLKSVMNDFTEELDLMPGYQRQVISDVRDIIFNSYLNVLLGAMQQTGPTGGPNNDLPRDKDDQWNLWKAYFGMMPPRQSKGQGVKRK